MSHAGRAFVLRTGAFGRRDQTPPPCLGHLSARPKDKGAVAALQ
jgi:hypothetical protein